jgi:hypothetical protein
MNLLQHYFRRLIGIMTLIVMMSVSSCSGITPDGSLRNDREEGPEQGLFSGPDGEFVLVAPASAANEKNAEDAKDQQ